LIRINLLPQAQRRRRLRLRSGVALGGAMLLGWALVIGLGYVWIAGHTARAGELRARAAEATAATRKLEKKRDNPALAERQRVLRIRQEALAQLRRARGGPGAALREFAALLAASPALRPLEVHAPSLDVWRVDGLARDVDALAELVARVRREANFHLSFGPEYARTDAGDLRFRLDLAVAAQP
jgi:Tfp pilus assembly protein PilN